MKNRIFLALVAVAFLLSACATVNEANLPKYTIPANDYREIDCAKMSELVVTMVKLQEAGLSIDDAYARLTPEGSSLRVQSVHMLVMGGFYAALGSGRVESAVLNEELESMCVDTEILEDVALSNRALCLALDETRPVITMLQRTRLPLRSVISQVGSAAGKVPLPFINDSQKLVARKLPGFIENYITMVYEQKGDSSSETVMDSCAIDE